MGNPSRHRDRAPTVIDKCMCIKHGIAQVLLASEGFAVCWYNHVEEMGGHLIYIQILAANGAPAGRPRVVNKRPTLGAPRVTIASLHDGGCVVYWQDRASDGNRGWGQRLDEYGRVIGTARELPAEDFTQIAVHG